MKIAIHHSTNSFSGEWIKYCCEKDIVYKVVNCYENNIIGQLNDCDALLWHHSHVNYKDRLFAKQLLYSLERAGKKVYPDFNTTWHFDDKVGQKYLLEALGLPLVPSYVFYTKKEALEWIQNASFPKVFKLRGGASSDNVRLVSSKKEAKHLINNAFGRGFSQFNRWNYLKERYRKVKEGTDPFAGLLKGLGRLFIPVEFAVMAGKEKGYVFFQDFIENEGFDMRVIVVGDKAVSLKRLVRKDDFRASGSGNFILENENVNLKFIEEAFKMASLLKTQSLAVDFILSSKSGEIFIVEISYGFVGKVYLERANGYWTKNLEWIKASVDPRRWIIEDMLGPSHINSLQV